MSKRTLIALTINTIGLFAATGMVIGAIFIEYDLKEQPCPLCLLQRLGLLGVALGGVLNLRFGFKPAHLAVSLLFAIMGGSVSLRQTFLHIVPGSPPGPSTPVAGYDLWWWAFLAFATAGVAIAAILLLIDTNEKPAPVRHFVTTLATLAVGLVAAANIVITITLCGLGPCSG